MFNTYVSYIKLLASTEKDKSKRKINASITAVCGGD